MATAARQRVELPTLYQQYIHQTRYARWRDDLGRRETWAESVDRYVAWASAQTLRHGLDISAAGVADELWNGIAGHRAMPSMRAFMTAGAALERDNVAGYNCAYVAIDHPRAFDESLYILMCGTGVGFSVERQFIARLPEVPDEIYPADDTIVVADSRKGWASAYRRLLALLWSGHAPKWDLSRLRPAGARLKTFGGRSAGPAPLDALFRYTVDVFMHARGRRLTSIDCHGLMCKIGDIVVSGGVRRSALISLSNPSDERMRDAKSGQWYDDPMRKHYQLANNSAAWTEKPDALRFLDEWTALVRSKSGERGIINRQALVDQVARFGRRDPGHEFGVNPCSEIILRSEEFCNLTEVVVRPSDTLWEFEEKVRIATILGTIQSTLTDFKYLRSSWKKNCEEERLLGVSITGQMDHGTLSGVSDESARWLNEGREVARQVNEEYAQLLGVEPSAAITCQKPSGTVSQLVDSASGGHRRHSPYYLRRTRDSKGDPAAEVVRMSGVPCEEDAMKPDNWVMTWPIKAPEGSRTREDERAVDQLRMWLHVNDNWCEHKPSVTITVREEEWVEVGAFVYEHFDKMSGVSFLPHSDHIYQQPPYEAVTRAEYEAAAASMPEEIGWHLLGELEVDDMTSSAKELACTAGACEIP